MRFDKEVWRAVWEFIKSFVFSFLLFYFAFDMWHLATGDMRPLRKKGILVEWLVHSQMEQNDSIDEYDRHTYTGLRITYTYHEPLLFKEASSVPLAPSGK